MIKVSRTNVFGFESAIIGMRNPLNSWSKSDSFTQTEKNEEGDIQIKYYLGMNDLDLAKRLVKSGSDHRKFLRMIHVQADVLAPLYWWKEYDTYKVGTVANSCSTMHKITAKKFELADFSHDRIESSFFILFERLVAILNDLREKYLETKNKEYWYSIIQFLPSSYNQLRTIDLNYEVLIKIYFGRKNHKLDEWRSFCDWILDLPYMKEFIEELEK